MTSNKRIHELLEWVKSSQIILENKKVIMDNTDYLKLMFILQHLLEVDIENHDGRKYCDKHDIDFKYILSLEERPNAFQAFVNRYRCPECFKESQQDKKPNDS